MVIAPVLGRGFPAQIVLGFLRNLAYPIRVDRLKLD